MNLPKDGWHYVSTTDMKEIRTRCELCGTPIRYVHQIEHKGANLVLEIGCECASNVMSGSDLDYIKDRDKEIKNAANREKAKDARLRKNFEDRNKYYKDRGLPELSWEDYLALIEKNTKGEK